METITSNNLALYVFSFNRGRFLDNCMKSVQACAPELATTIIDDQSSDSATQEVLGAYESEFRIIRAGDGGEQEYKTGGLYNNMRFAFAEARRRGYAYVLFLQDDMQLVRPITESDLAGVDAFFQANPKAAELHTCFMKRFFATLDEEFAELDSSSEAYLRPSSYPGFTGFSAVGLFHLDRLDALFGDLRQGEYLNNEHAQREGIQMGFSSRPFMMWLPYPISHRGKERNLSLRLVEGLAGCGYYPYRIMSDGEVDAFVNRDLQKKPFAEDWLEPVGLGRVPIWSFAGGLSNLYARGGIRARIASILQKLQ